MPRTASLRVASAPSPYTVSVGKATGTAVSRNAVAAVRSCLASSDVSSSCNSQSSSGSASGEDGERSVKRPSRVASMGRMWVSISEDDCAL